MMIFFFSENALKALPLLLASYFNITLPIKHLGHENKENQHQPEKVLTVKNIVVVSAIGNVSGTVLRICILILGGMREKEREGFLWGGGRGYVVQGTFISTVAG